MGEIGDKDRIVLEVKQKDGTIRYLHSFMDDYNSPYLTVDPCRATRYLPMDPKKPERAQMLKEAKKWMEQIESTESAKFVPFPEACDKYNKN